jgi:hypothetical protein
MKTINPVIKLQQTQSMLRRYGCKQQAKDLKLYRTRTEALSLLKKLSKKAIELNRSTRTINLSTKKLNRAWRVLAQMKKLNMRVDIDIVRDALMAALDAYRQQGYKSNNCS